MLQPVSKVGDLEMSEEPQIPEAINSDLLAEPEEVEGEELENYISCAEENLHKKIRPGNNSEDNYPGFAPGYLLAFTSPHCSRRTGSNNQKPEENSIGWSKIIFF